MPDHDSAFDCRLGAREIDVRDKQIVSVRVEKGDLDPTKEARFPLSGGFATRSTRTLGLRGYQLPARRGFDEGQVPKSRTGRQALPQHQPSADHKRHHPKAAGTIERAHLGSQEAEVIDERAHSELGDH